jgi:hypothetical protein
MRYASCCDAHQARDAFLAQPRVAAVTDSTTDAQQQTGAACLRLQELAALLKIELGGAGFDHSVSFTLRRVQLGVALYRCGDPFGPIYAIRSGTFKNVLLDANGGYQVLGFPFP